MYFWKITPFTNVADMYVNFNGILLFINKFLNFRCTVVFDCSVPYHSNYHSNPQTVSKPGSLFIFLKILKKNFCQSSPFLSFIRCIQFLLLYIPFYKINKNWCNHHPSSSPSLTPSSSFLHILAFIPPPHYNISFLIEPKTFPALSPFFFQFSSSSHSCMPSPLAPDPIRVQPCV